MYRDNEPLIVDGEAGIMIAGPDEGTLREYQQTAVLDLKLTAHLIAEPL